METKKKSTCLYFVFVFVCVCMCVCVCVFVLCLYSLCSTIRYPPSIEHIICSHTHSHTSDPAPVHVHAYRAHPEVRVEEGGDGGDDEEAGEDAERGREPQRADHVAVVVRVDVDAYICIKVGA